MRHTQNLTSNSKPAKLASQLATFILCSQLAPLQADPAAATLGDLGFVLSHIEFALAADAEETGACPSGMSLNLMEIYALTPAGKQRPGESAGDYGERLVQEGQQLGKGPNNEDLCLSPEVADKDPYFRAVESSDIPVGGIDLDGETGPEDFPGLNGETGIDNQFFRVNGCTRSFQSSGQFNQFATEMLTGAWGIVITLGDVDDIHNDDYVTVGIHANADPIQLSPARQPLPYATYAIDPDKRYQATTTGRIDDGVLTTEPVDVRFHSVTNSMTQDRPLRDARLQATLSADGTLSGYLAGYTPVEELYDFLYGYRSGQVNGERAPQALRSLTGNGKAQVLGYTCHGVYQALHQHADGHPDPQTGHYTSLSTQYRFEALPAFIVASSNSKPLTQNDPTEHSHDD